MAQPPYIWDYDIDESTFREILAGKTTIGRLDRDWAAARLLEHAPYKEIVRLLGFHALIEGWPAWRSRIRSESRKRGFDFLAREWIPSRHPELLAPWLRNRRREKLEEEIELYDRSLSAAEGEEDAEWAELSGRLLGESWR